MKKNTKGFTLIELLAVIVILAIIALIATPLVLNLINTAKKGAAARSAEGIRASISKQYFARMVVDPTGDYTINAYDFAATTNGVKNNDKNAVLYEAIKDTNNNELEPAVTLGDAIDGKLPTAGKISVNNKGEVIGTDLIIDNFKCSFGATGSATCVKS